MLVEMILRRGLLALGLVFVGCVGAQAQRVTTTASRTLLIGALGLGVAFLGFVVTAFGLGLGAYLALKP